MMASRLLTLASKPTTGRVIQRLTRSAAPCVTATTKALTPPKREFSAAAAVAAVTSAGDNLHELTQLNPHKEIVRYEHKNVKWTMQHVDLYSDMLAIGFLDAGLTKGDAVVSWLPSHWGEQHILQFACSKAGFVLYTLPTPTSTTPISKTALAQSLSLTSATVLVVPEHHDEVDYISVVKSVVPETRIFDFGCGSQFVSPGYPHLRFPVHTGFTHENGKYGFLPFRHMLVHTENLGEFTEGFGLDGNTELCGVLEVDKDGGVSVGKVMTNSEVVKSGVWPTFNSILERDYQEIGGVGVVF